MTPQIEHKKQEIELLKETFQNTYKTSAFKGTFHQWIQNATWGTPLSIREFTSYGLSSEEIEQKLQRKAVNNDIVNSVFLDNLAHQAPFSTQFMCDLHSYLFDHVTFFAGIYRSFDVRLTNTAIKVPSHYDVPSRMKDMEKNYTESQRNVLDILSLNFNIFVTQPFLNGNKTIARTITNYELLSQGYSPLLFSSQEDKSMYISSVEKSYTEKNMDYFYDFMLTKMTLTAKDSLLILQGKEPIRQIIMPTIISSHGSQKDQQNNQEKQKE